jgi:hypothetical protein
MTTIVLRSFHFAPRATDLTEYVVVAFAGFDVDDLWQCLCRNPGARTQRDVLTKLLIYQENVQLIFHF